MALRWAAAGMIEARVAPPRLKAHRGTCAQGCARRAPGRYFESTRELLELLQPLSRAKVPQITPTLLNGAFPLRAKTKLITKIKPVPRKCIEGYGDD